MAGGGGAPSLFDLAWDRVEHPKGGIHDGGLEAASTLPEDAESIGSVAPVGTATQAGAGSSGRTHGACRPTVLHMPSRLWSCPRRQ